MNSDAIKQAIRVDEQHIDVWLFTQMLNDAIAADIKPVNTHQLYDQCILLPMFKWGDCIDLDDGRPQHVEIRMVFRYMAEWVEEVGALLGLADPHEPFAFHWVTSEMPHVSDVVWALSEIVTEAMAQADAAHKAQHGYSIAEVFVASIEGGIDFEQAKAQIEQRRSPDATIH